MKFLSQQTRCISNKLGDVRTQLCCLVEIEWLSQYKKCKYCRVFNRLCKLCELYVKFHYGKNRYCPLRSRRVRVFITSRCDEHRRMFLGNPWGEASARHEKINLWKTWSGFTQSLSSPKSQWKYLLGKFKRGRCVVVVGGCCYRHRKNLIEKVALGGSMEKFFWLKTFPITRRAVFISSRTSYMYLLHDIHSSVKCHRWSYFNNLSSQQLYCTIISRMARESMLNVEWPCWYFNWWEIQNAMLLAVNNKLLLLPIMFDGRYRRRHDTQQKLLTQLIVTES